MDNFYILWIGLLLITLNLIILILWGNAIVIICVFQYKRLQTAANYIVVSLAITDILLALCLPFPLLENRIQTNAYFGLISNHLQATASGASMITISIIAYDRYLAVNNPLSYKMEMTKRKTLYFIGFAWIYSAIVSWGPVLIGWINNSFSFVRPFSSQAFLQSAYTLQLITVFLPSCCTLFFCYTNIYFIARHHSLAIAALETSLKSNRRMMYRNTKYSKTIVSIIGTFLSLWLPFQIGVLLTNISDFRITYTTWKTLHYLAFFNSVVNPWTYALKTSDFQSAFKQLHKGSFKSESIKAFIYKQKKILSFTKNNNNNNNNHLKTVAVVQAYQNNYVQPKSYGFLSHLKKWYKYVFRVKTTETLVYKQPTLWPVASYNNNNNINNNNNNNNNDNQEHCNLRQKQSSEFQGSCKQTYNLTLETKKVKTTPLQEKVLCSVKVDTDWSQKSLTGRLPVYQTNICLGNQHQDFFLTYHKRKFGFRTIGKWSPQKLRNHCPSPR